jgi:hypothetical protein
MATRKKNKIERERERERERKVLIETLISLR